MRRISPRRRQNCKLKSSHSVHLIDAHSIRFSVLERNGTARRIAANYDLDTVRPFLDEDIEAAVNALEISTSATTEQNRILKLRKEALIDFQAYTQQTQTQYNRIAGLRQRNRLREKQNIDLAVMLAFENINILFILSLFCRLMKCYRL